MVCVTTGVSVSGVSTPRRLVRAHGSVLPGCVLMSMVRSSGQDRRCVEEAWLNVSGGFIAFVALSLDGGIMFTTYVMYHFHAVMPTTMTCRLSCAWSFVRTQVLYYTIVGMCGSCRLWLEKARECACFVPKMEWRARTFWESSCAYGQHISHPLARGRRMQLS